MTVGSEMMMVVWICVSICHFEVSRSRPVAAFVGVEAMVEDHKCTCYADFALLAIEMILRAMVAAASRWRISDDDKDYDDEWDLLICSCCRLVPPQDLLHHQ